MRFEPTRVLAKAFSFLKEIPFLPIFIDEQVKVFTLFFRPQVFSKMIDLVKMIRALPFVKSGYHKYGGLEFTVGGFEFCHIHSDGLVDILLRKDMAAEFIQTTAAGPHHILKNSGWLSYQIKPETDLTELFNIIEQAYQLKKNVVEA